jgi:hypothetical protein
MLSNGADYLTYYHFFSSSEKEKSNVFSGSIVGTCNLFSEERCVYVCIINRCIEKGKEFKKKKKNT